MRRSLSVQKKPALAVFCSGKGSNLQAIINATRTGKLRARVAIVITDVPSAYALKRARQAGIEALFVDPNRYQTRQSYERELIRLLTEKNIKLVCLAGFMRILSSVFVRAFCHRILNIHPALLPAFPGAHAIQDALSWGARLTGVTVHFADERVDHGPIILQEAVTIRPEDTKKSLLARVHRVEHRLYPKAIQLVLDRRVRIVGRTVKIS